MRSSLADLILPDFDQRVACMDIKQDAIAARDSAILARLRGRHPAEVKALEEFADRLAEQARGRAA